MKRLLIIAALVLASTSAFAEDMNASITVGRVTVSGGRATVPIIVTNNIDAALGYVGIECGFLRGDELVTSARGVTGNIPPHGHGYIDVVSTSIEQRATPDRADCRVVAANRRTSNSHYND